MTTIAYKDGVLAVDSRAAGEIVRSESTQKLFLVDGDWIAGCGTQQDMLLGVQWFRDGLPTERPKLEDAAFLVLKQSGELWRYEDKLIGWKLDEPFTASGSGYLLAIGAMAAGASAIEAVKIAARFDPNTNDKVQSTGKIPVKIIGHSPVRPPC